MLCCLLCLTVCVVPALAGNEQYTSGFIYPESGLSINYSTTGYNLDLLSGYFPATFGSESIVDASNYVRSFVVAGKSVPHPAGTYSYTLTTGSQFYIEVLFSVPAPLSFDLVDDPPGKNSIVSAKIGLGMLSSLTSFDESRASADISFVVDGVLHPLTVSSGDNFKVPLGSYEVKRYFGYRFYFNPLNINTVSSFDMGLKLSWRENNVKYTFSDPNYVEGIYDEVTVNSGVLQDINGTLTEIKTSTATIQSDVSEIKGGLQNSNSSIWQSFKDSVSGLFVPSSGDLESVKSGFDQLAQDKLGGAYQAVQMADYIVQNVSSGFKNPAETPSVEFPGISVPLGGDVGTVTLAASQTVTIPEKITEVLYPVAGVIIPFVCVIWTIRQCTDMVECFMSGMSYAEFLHRNSDKEDDEV